MILVMLLSIRRISPEEFNQSLLCTFKLSYLNIQIEQWPGYLKGGIDLQMKSQDQIVNRWKFMMEILRG